VDSFRNSTSRDLLQRNRIGKAISARTVVSHVCISDTMFNHVLHLMQQLVSGFIGVSTGKKTVENQELR
jgi:hypothetical protein